MSTIQATLPGGRKSDVPLHQPLLDRMDKDKGPAYKASLARYRNLGLSRAEAVKLLGKK